MKLNTRAERNETLFDDYTSVFFHNVEFGLEVIAAAATAFDEITVDRIIIDDGEETTQIDRIEDVKDFIEKYKDVDLKSVMLEGRYDDFEIRISVCFSGRTVQIGYPKDSGFKAKDFAVYLETRAESLSF